ncbi:MAG: glutamyl-tRNA reductase [bacterium]
MTTTTLPLAMLGLSHRDAAVGLRERFCLTPARFERVVLDLRRMGLVDGAFYLQTCNRIEIYCTTTDPVAALAYFRTALVAGIEPSEFGDLEWPVRTGWEAMLHLGRVAASLDSLVLGDTEILAQVRRAYEMARTAGWSDKLLNQIGQWALKVGKEVRTHTSIQQRAASVASLVAQELRRLPKDSTITVLGAGEIADAVMRNLKKAYSRLVVLNRSAESLERLAKDHQFTAGRLEDFAQHVGGAAALVSCVSVDTPLIDLATMDQATAGRPRPLRVYDLGVPRNIDPRVRTLPTVQLQDMDDLQAIVETNKAGRAEAGAEAEGWVIAQLKGFEHRWALAPLADALQAVRGRKSAPPSELPGLLEPHLATLSTGALAELARQLGPATALLPAHQRQVLTPTVLP